ncbi:MAG: glycosyl hydrolase, partial [Eubacteriales bacterium]|nr:glycosyl hydrolase [Eubacteriales bacterium]
ELYCDFTISPSTISLNNSNYDEKIDITITMTQNSADIAGLELNFEHGSIFEITEPLKVNILDRKNRKQAFSIKARDGLSPRVVYEERIYITADNDIRKWVDIEMVIVDYDVSDKLINQEATIETKRLMKYLADCYGEYIITGQHQSSGLAKQSPEFMEIFNVTGKYPALGHFDFKQYSPSWVEKEGDPKVPIVENAINWYNEEGGIVTFCWHWAAPSKFLTKTKYPEPWKEGFRTGASDIDIAKIMKSEDEEGYELIIKDIDAIALQLKKLADKNVPVLWRPLHEASGGWFWWGANGSEAYIELWKLIYDRLVNYHGLNNLIWVWNGQDKSWYPGDGYVDILGEDVYGPKYDYSSHTDRFRRALAYSGISKIIAYTEVGAIPDPDNLFKDNTIISWFVPWGGSYINDYNENSMLQKVYNHKKVITLDEVPDLKKYPLD